MKYYTGDIVMKNVDYGTHFEAYLLTEKRVAQNTFDAYRRDLAQFFEFLQRHTLHLTTITKTELKIFLKELHDHNLSSSSISRKISCLKSFFHYLHKRYDLVNHGDSLIFPKLEKNLPQFLNEDDVKKLLIKAEQVSQAVPEGITRAGSKKLPAVKAPSDGDRRNYVMLYTLYATGMRISELLELTVSSFDFDAGYVKVHGKGGKDRIVPLTQEAQAMIKEYLQTTYPAFLSRVTMYRSKKHTDSIFPTLYGNSLKPMSRQAFWGYVKDMAVQAGIKAPLFPHQIRHSLATHLLEKGANLRSIQLLLGHENLKTVEIYTNIGTTHLRKVYDKFHPRS